MATEIRHFSLVLPAGTLPTAPVEQVMAFPPRDVEAIQIVVPTGSSGLVGFAIDVGGAQVIPYLSDDWIITAGENITWPLEEMPNSGAWSVRGYNQGTNQHTLYFRWLLRAVTPTAAPLTPMIDDAAISASSTPIFADSGS